MIHRPPFSSCVKEKLGDQWIKTYRGELTAEVLARAVREVKSAREERVPDISFLSPTTVAQQTINFYREILNVS